ncbi:TolC family protein [Flavobacterium sp. CYK-4]|uniref:TolC family protein n=1 Tax=Flavobacterium lotistagni TaxID=2709660 RepID=UPI00140D01E8|nr:TolC family protein [Flavobacterium lotistagni]NHM08250.1 TolC family protein [Flavobacterium lotistagni]
MKKHLLLLLILPQLCLAQDLMTFKDCLELAMKNNLDLKTALNQEQIAKTQYRSSYGKLAPNLYGTAENKNSWGRDIDPNSNLFINTDIKNYVGYINATYNLFAGFTTLNTIRLNKQEYRINQSNVQKVQNEITIDLAEKFITILYLQEIIAANEKQIEASQKQLELAQLKFEAGSIPEGEVFKIKSQKASEELNLITHQNNLIDNMVSLKQLMNLPLEKEITLVKPILQLDSNVNVEDQYGIIKQALDLNPAITMSKFREKKARAALALARASRYPVLSMRAQYGTQYTKTDYEDNEEDLLDFREQIRNNEVNILRFNLIVPIFSQFDNRSKIKTSRILYKQSKIDTQIKQNELSKTVLKAITDTKTSLKKNEASAKAFEFSQKSFEADLLKFELGKINTNELNVTKANYNNSQAQLIQSKYELLYNNALIKFYLGEAFSL